MTGKVNIEAKNLLAKLLASENIWIRHCRVETASFDLVQRVLTFPMWKEMSDCVYTLLAGHETSHALHAYDTVKGKRVNVSATVYAKRIDPQNLDLAGMYWNIVLDARDERLIKVPYPGMKAVFATGYRELYDNDMFGIKTKTSRQIDALSLIDRINLQSKIGHVLQLTFTSEEETLLRKVATTITMDDVVEVTKEIYNWSKKNELQPPPPITMKMTMEELEKFLKDNPDIQPGNGCGGQKIEIEITDLEGDKEDEDGDESGSGDDDEGDDKGNGDKSGNGKSKSGNEKDEKDDGKEGGDSGKEANGDGKEGAKPKKNGKGKVGGKQVSNGREFTKPVDPGPPPSPSTQHHFDEMLKKLLDPNAQEIVYVTLPKPNLKNIIIPYENVHEGIRRHFGRDKIEQAEKDFAAFRDAQLPIINYILQQFEMRKQADRYKRTRQHKTGMLDTLQLSNYKTRDDIFKTIAICQDGKNHGLIFVVDWSGSMQNQMAGTLEQLIILCLFCRKAQIPFEALSLTTGGTNAFSREPGNLAYAQNFRMRNYISSKMVPAEFVAACVNLFALMPDGRFSGGPTADNLIGCTPLDESIITTIDLIKEFKTKTGAQIIHSIFLTDGGANTVSQYFDMAGNTCNMGGRNYYYNSPTTNSGTKYLVDDRETHKTYAFTIGNMTPTMVKILRDRNNINAVCFYVGGQWDNFFTSAIDNVKRTQLNKEFQENGFVISTEWGFNATYITKQADWRLKDIRLRPQKIEVGTPEYLKQVEKNFIAQGQNLMKQRILLDHFVGMIA
jgi:hypothetical protein